jgi:hypothetical protein
MVYVLEYTEQVKVKVNFNLEQATKARRGGGVDIYLYSFFNLGARWE